MFIPIADKITTLAGEQIVEMKKQELKTIFDKQDKTHTDSLMKDYFQTLSCDIKKIRD